MTQIADLIGTLNHYLEAQRQLNECRLQATGNVEYYSYSYQQDFTLAEKGLERALNDYIDQRVAEKLAQLRLPTNDLSHVGAMSAVG
jgi:hypothetical protein